jgi:hypothetical protein
MGNIIQTSSPFIRKFVHTTTSVTAITGATAQTLLAAAGPGDRRITTLIQNQHSTNTATIILSPTDTVGVVIQPGTFFSVDNYNGTVRAFASASGTPIHIATSNV